MLNVVVQPAFPARLSGQPFRPAFPARLSNQPFRPIYHIHRM